MDNQFIHQWDNIVVIRIKIDLHNLLFFSKATMHSLLAPQSYADAIRTRYITDFREIELGCPSRTIVRIVRREDTHTYDTKKRVR